jgi:hypothetical protein
MFWNKRPEDTHDTENRRKEKEIAGSLPSGWEKYLKMSEMPEKKVNLPEISEVKSHSDEETQKYLFLLEVEDDFEDLSELVAETKRILEMPVMPAGLTQSQVESIWEPKEKF